ncbi:putative protein phosphatase 2C 67 [Glycine soja]
MLLHPRSQRSNLVERVPMLMPLKIRAPGTPWKMRRSCFSTCAHFAIYDGHGGRLAAEYARKHLHQNVLSAGLPRELVSLKLISLFFKKVLKVVVANIGDAKAVLARSTNGSQNHPDGVQTQLKAIVLTREHKPIFQLERARIEKVIGSL